MNDTNIVVLVGRLTKDPELKTTASGNYVARLDIACNRSVKKGDNWENQPSFFNVVVWNDAAKSCDNYLHKGSRVAVQGRLEQRSWEDRDTGAKRYAVEIVAFSVQFLDPKPENQQSQPTNYNQTQQSAPNYGQNEFGPDMSDDDLPF